MSEMYGRRQRRHTDDDIFVAYVCLCNIVIIVFRHTCTHASIAACNSSSSAGDGHVRNLPGVLLRPLQLAPSASLPPSVPGSDPARRKDGRQGQGVAVGRVEVELAGLPAAPRRAGHPLLRRLPPGRLQPVRQSGRLRRTSFGAPDPTAWNHVENTQGMYDGGGFRRHFWVREGRIRENYL